MSKRLTTEEFVEKAKKVHGDKYDYSKVEYIGTHKKIIIICPIHGEFEQTPHDHLVSGCKQCYNDKRGDYTRSNKEEFIEKARSIHGDKYDYSKVNYINNKTKICIICPIHGEFYQTPMNHLSGNGCNKCGIEHKNLKNSDSLSDFIIKSKIIHGNKYNYSKVEYINNHTKVCIICPIHGEFWQLPTNHLKGCGCPCCSNNDKMSKEKFVEKAKKIHGEKYDYSKVEYINNSTKVCIICPIHGEFWQRPNDHLNKKGCKKCSNEKIKKIRRNTTKEFVEKAKKIHGDKYDYSKVEYVNNHTKVCIICPIHGEFWITPHNHIITKNPQGCKKCGYEKASEQKTMSFDEFVNKAKLKHGDKYDYSNSIIDENRRVNIKCNKCGYMFNQLICYHLNGSGCPHCRFSHLENEIEIFLKEKNIEFIPQYRIGNQYLDFYLPKYNTGIECQGEQHFKSNFFNKFNDGKKSFINSLERDIRKYNRCLKYGIKLYYYTNFNVEKVDNILSIYNENNLFFDKNKLIEKII